MTPINNSDTAWLIVSDYNQDNGKFYEELREDILNPEINNWLLCGEYNNGLVGNSWDGNYVGDFGHRVGSNDSFGEAVGSQWYTFNPTLKVHGSNKVGDVLR